MFTICRNAMKTFSERYGYIKPSDVIIREEITPEIRNAICSAYDDLKAIYNQYYYNGYLKVESHIWCLFLNKHKGDYWVPHSSFVRLGLSLETGGMVPAQRSDG